MHVHARRAALCVGLLILTTASHPAADAPASTRTDLRQAQEAVGLALMAIDLEQWALAREHLLDAQRIAPAVPEIALLLGRVAGKLPGHEQEALGWLSAYLSVRPRDSAASEIAKQIEGLEEVVEGKVSALMERAEGIVRAARTVVASVERGQLEEAYLGVAAWRATLTGIYPSVEVPASEAGAAPGQVRRPSDPSMPRSRAEQAAIERGFAELEKWRQDGTQAERPLGANVPAPAPGARGIDARTDLGRRFARIRDEATERDVTIILGPPTAVERVNVLGLAGTALRWQKPEGTVAISFVDGKLAQKTFKPAMRLVLARITKGATVDEMVALLGRADDVTGSHDQFTMTWWGSDGRLVVQFDRGKVTSAGIDEYSLDPETPGPGKVLRTEHEDVAREAAELISDARLKQRLLAVFAGGRALCGDRTAASLLFDAISDRTVRPHAVRALTRGHARRGAAALSADPDAAVGLAEAGSVDEAVRRAASVTTGEQRDRALAGIAIAAARHGDLAAAYQAAERIASVRAKHDVRAHLAALGATVGAAARLPTAGDAPARYIAWLRFVNKVIIGDAGPQQATSRLTALRGDAPSEVVAAIARIAGEMNELFLDARRLRLLQRGEIEISPCGLL